MWNPGMCEGLRWTGMQFNPKLKRWRKAHLEGHEFARVHPNGLGVVQEVFGLRSAPSGAEIDDPLQTRKEGHGRVWQNDGNHHPNWKERLQTGRLGDGTLREKRGGLRGRSSRTGGDKMRIKAS